MHLSKLVGDVAMAKGVWQLLYRQFVMRERERAHMWRKVVLLIAKKRGGTCHAFVLLLSGVHKARALEWGLRGHDCFFSCNPQNGLVFAGLSLYGFLLEIPMINCLQA